MELCRRDLVWIDLRNTKRLGMVLEVRKHVAIVRPYHPSKKRLHAYAETISRRMLVKAELPPEQLAALPCGKRVLSLNKAFEIVAVNRIFTDNAVRRERRVYYCTRCRGFHTTSQAKIPGVLLQRLRSDPFAQPPDDVHDGRYRRLVFLWLRDRIGVPMGYGMFLASLERYAPTDMEAIEKLLANTKAYLYFVYRHLYLSGRRGRRKPRTGS